MGDAFSLEVLGQSEHILPEENVPLVAAEAPRIMLKEELCEFLLVVDDDRAGSFKRENEHVSNPTLEFDMSNSGHKKEGTISGLNRGGLRTHRDPTYFNHKLTWWYAPMSIFALPFPQIFTKSISVSHIWNLLLPSFSTCVASLHGTRSHVQTQFGAAPTSAPVFATRRPGTPGPSRIPLQVLRRQQPPWPAL